MSTLELVLNMLAEATTTKDTNTKNSNYSEQKNKKETKQEISICQQIIRPFLKFPKQKTPSHQYLLYFCKSDTIVSLIIDFCK